MFSKFFGKKNDGFYLQLEDEKQPAKPTDTTNSAPVAAPVAAVVETPAVEAETAPVAAKSAPNNPKEIAKAEKEAVKAAKKSAKKTESAKKAAEAPAPVMAAVAVAPAITNFATDYLIKPSSNSSRRRPGANMNQFLDMARTAKKPEPFKK